MASTKKSKKEIFDKETLPDTFEVIEQTAIVNVQISYSFFNRLSIVYQDILQSKSQEEITTAFEQIKNGTVAELWIQNLETMLILLKEFQKNAQAEGKVKKVSKSDYEEMIKKSLDTDQK